MTEFWQTIVGILGSIGVGCAIVVGLSSWLGKIWAERLMAQETAKYREELERLAKQLERKNYVSKVRFDAEFAIYRELCALTDEMERTVYMLFPAQIDYLPRDEEAKKEVFLKRYENANSAYVRASKSLSKNSAFIPKEIYDLFLKVENLCRMQVNLYPDYLKSGEDKLDRKLELKCWERTLEMDKAYEELQEKLRDHLKKLDVFDF